MQWKIGITVATTLSVIGIITACGGSDDATPPSYAEAVGTPAVRSTDEVGRHLQAATLNAYGDDFLINNLRKFYCLAAEDRNADLLAARANKTRVPLTQVTDDVWYQGDQYVGQYILKNNNSFMLLDTLNNATEAQTYTTPALVSLGLSTQLPLDSVFLTHGHGDHDGGAQYLRNTYNPHIYLGSADLYLGTSNGAPKSYAPTTIDSVNYHPKEISMGGRSVIVFPTPGHTDGATSAIISAYDGGKPIKLLVTGGSSMPTSPDGMLTYTDSVERTYQYAEQYQVDGNMHPHIYWDGSSVKILDIISNGRKSPSQFVAGHAKVMQGLAIARECSAAQAARLNPTVAYKQWRVSQLSFVSQGQANPSAKLTNAWGPLVGRRVTLIDTTSGASCDAATNSDGIATCTVNGTSFAPSKAVFGGLETADAVELNAAVSR